MKKLLMLLVLAAGFAIMSFNEPLESNNNDGSDCYIWVWDEDLEYYFLVPCPPRPCALCPQPIE